MENIGILHISDTHINANNKKDIKRIISLLINDAKKIATENSIDIKFIAFTGDIINSGEKSKDEYIYAYEHILFPLEEGLDISTDNFYIVPGNHEVDRSIISSYSEAGLSQLLTNNENISKFLNKIDNDSIKRIKNFDEIIDLYSGTPVLSTPLYNCYINEYSSTKFGIACMNSSWRSTGIGEAERGKLIIGKKQMLDCLDAIKNADIKVGLFHHPTDWLTLVDKYEVEKVINSFDIILNGHLHLTDSKFISSFIGKTLFNVAGKLYPTEDWFNGYSLISINPLNRDCKVHLRHYYEHPRNEFDYDYHLNESGIYETRLDSSDKTSITTYDIAYNISKKFNDYVNSFFIHNLLENDNRSFEELFIEPTISYFSEGNKESYYRAKRENSKIADTEKVKDEYIKINEIISNSCNYIIYGKKESGKTTLLHYLSKFYLQDFKIYKQVPIIINLKDNINSTNKILTSINSFINSFVDDSFSVSRSEIIELLQAGKFLIIFDNSETIDFTKNIITKEFIALYSNNRFIFTCEEDISTHLESISEEELFEGFTELYIWSFKKNQIRQLTKSWTGIKEDEKTNEIIDKLQNYFKHTCLPRTPFNVSLVYSIFKNNSNFVPINEASVIENFLYILLEKFKDNNVGASTYDYGNKEDFLIFLVSVMLKKNEYFFSETEFSEVCNKYHLHTGFSESETLFSNFVY